MVYIYKKKIGNKSYYYLRVSERKGKRIIVKDLAYLGSSIKDVKKALETLSKYKDKIRKANKTIKSFLESNYYLEQVKKLKLKHDFFLKDNFEKVEACKIHFSKKFNKLNDLTKQEIFKNFVIEFAFNTTSIEGNTITLKEARNLLEEGFTPKDKTLREIYDLQNTEKVFFELVNSRREISHDLIIEIHKKLLDKIDLRNGYRTIDIHVTKSRFKPTPAQYVKTDMSLLLEWYNENQKKLHPLVLAAMFHHKFEKIHPFADGNGRTGRMLLNYILLKKNYPPLIIKKKFRIDYLDAMQIADGSDLNKNKTEDYFNLVQFISEELVSSYWGIFLF